MGRTRVISRRGLSRDISLFKGLSVEDFRGPRTRAPDGDAIN